MSRVDYPDAELMAMHLADALAGELNAALMTHERVCLAVPGGSTPGPVFDTLSALHLDWARVTVVPTDERWVAPDHPRSNEALIRSRLLQGEAAAARFLPLWRAGMSPEAAAEAAGADLAPLLPLSVLLLGMGDDMHTASLFPGAAGLSAALDADAPPVAVLTPQGQAETRLSLTAPVLDGALAKHVAITGAEKRAALDEARRLPPEAAPVHAVLTGATIHWAP
jgi:6-phosphogluconolactonase